MTPREMVSIEVLDRLLKANIDPLREDLRGLIPRIEALEEFETNIVRYKWAVRMLTTACVAVLGTIGAIALWGLSMWDKISSIWPHSA